MPDVLAVAEAHLTVQQRFRIAAKRSKRLLARTQKLFDESQHPRDEHGRWTDGGVGDDIDIAKVEARTRTNVTAASSKARAEGVTPLPGSKGEHPNIIASRNPTGKGAKVEYGQPDVASMKLDPKRYAHDIGLFKNADFYPNFRASDFSGSTDQATSAVVAQMKDNLKFLYGFADKPTEVWYDGARALVDDRVKLYGFNDASVAAVYAALSPTKDWDQNVHIADMLMQTYKNQQGHRWDSKMDAKAATLWSKKLQPMVDLVRGKSLGELTSPAEKAMWIRTYDETHNDASYRTVLPNGALGPVTLNKDGTPSKVVWQSLPAITNAVKALEANGDQKIISDAMGTAHKVRSFYNNILDPHSANGDVTIDTHAVGAALLRQLSSGSVAVAHNFGNTPMKVDQPPGWEAAGSSVKTGLSGLYPVYAQAYREAAKELGIQPRQLQSAVWVVKRNTFGNLTKKQQGDVEAAWHDYHDDPKLTLADTQAAIAKIIGLDKNERSHRDDATGGRAGHPRELHRGRVGPAAAAVDGGSGARAAPRAAGLVAVRRAQRRAGAEDLEHRDAHTDWMNECVPELMDRGRDQLVAVAACLNMWRDAWEESHPDGADDPGPDRPQKQMQFAGEALARGAWNEADHPRVPAGSSDGGQFGPGGGDAGGGDSKPSSKPKKSKKPAKKEDFDKAKITIRKGGGGGSAQSEQEFIAKWNEKIGIEPEEFKKSFLGGVNASMTIIEYGNGSKYDVSGSIWGEGANEGAEVGTYQREIKLDDKKAYSAYFKLNKAQTKKDIGKKILGGNVEMYEALGLDKVEVSANIDVGGYAWAKYGYVPTAASWSELSSRLERKLGGDSSSSSSSSSGNTMEADSWDMLSSDKQDDVRDRWMRDTRSEFLESEEQNWRESGQALEDSKNTLVDLYNEGSIPEWTSDAFAAVRETRDDAGDPPIPYTDQQLFAAISLDYKSTYGDGRDNPQITFDDDKLKEPQGYDPAQQTLPGIEPLDPAQFLSQEMRDQLENEMVDSFNKKAEANAEEVDPPDYLADSVEEYQDEYWNSKDDADKLRHAIDYGMADIELPPDDEDEASDDGLGLNPELFPPDEDPLLAAVRSSDPKSIWKIADSARGKELLLGTNWSGVLNLKDGDAMKRFKTYVGKAAHD
jgi:hypothetical protein